LNVKPGSRLLSVIDATEVIVVRSPAVMKELTCGGRPMTSAPRDSPIASPGSVGGNGILVGKRYTNSDDGLEVLCVVSGLGPLAYGGEQLTIKSAKPLPSSD
jgi:hypothetical protein